MNNTNAAAADTLSPRALATRQRFAAQHAAVRNANRAAIQDLARLMEGCATVVSFEGEGTDESVVFASAVTGVHSLDLYSTDAERFVGHLEGFLSSQPDTKGGWFRLRVLSREERENGSETCDACMALLPVPVLDTNAPNAFVVATDFGCFCTLGCAIAERGQYLDAAAENADA